MGKRNVVLNAMARTYTSAVQVDPDDPEEEYEVELKVGVQSFRLGRRMDHQEATWYRAMLGQALENLVKLEEDPK